MQHLHATPKMQPGYSYSSLPNIPVPSPTNSTHETTKRIAYPPESTWVSETETRPMLYIGAGTDLHPLVQFPNVKTFLYIDGLPGSNFYNPSPSGTDSKHYSTSIKGILSHMRAQLPFLDDGKITMQVSPDRHNDNPRNGRRRGLGHSRKASATWHRYRSSITSLLHLHAPKLTLQHHGFNRSSISLSLNHAAPAPPEPESLTLTFSTGQTIHYWFNLSDTAISAYLKNAPSDPNTTTSFSTLYNSCKALLVHGWLPTPISLNLRTSGIQTVYHTRVFERVREYDWSPDTTFESVFHWNFCTKQEAEEFERNRGWAVPVGFWTFERRRSDGAIGLGNTGGGLEGVRKSGSWGREG